MGDADDVQRRLWELGQGTSASLVGIVVTVDWVNRVAVVNSAGFEQPMPWLGPAPWRGSEVRVLSLGKQVMCALIEGAPIGTAQTTAGGISMVLGDDGVKYLYPHRGDAPTAGDRVRLDHAGRAVEAGKYSTEPPGSDYVPPPVPPPTGGSSWFTSVWGGNWRSNADQGNDVTISDSRTAAYGWNSMIADTIPDSATVTTLLLYLEKAEELGPTSTVPSLLGTHGESRRPAVFNDGFVAGSVGVAPAWSVVVDLLAAGYGNAFKTGSACGVGFKSGNGWRRYAQSARIYAEWR